MQTLEPGRRTCELEQLAEVGGMLVDRSRYRQVQHEIVALPGGAYLMTCDLEGGVPKCSFCAS